MVTYSDLFAFVSMICSIVTLVVTLKMCIRDSHRTSQSLAISPAFAISIACSSVGRFGLLFIVLTSLCLSIWPSIKQEDVL